MLPYRNLSGNSNVVSYEATDDTIHVVFATGTYRNYLYNYSRPGKQMVDRMKVLAAQGFGLNSYISTTVKKNYAKKW